ncbi:MAG: AAA family ATPase, partial [Victivallales bacterium]|nr:AAA family ATPase [Victivallales bacterium]
MKQRIIGREREQKTLMTLYSSGSSEFVAVCGRRRVGKTFLVRELFEGKLSFSVSGLAHSSAVQQLENFRNSLRRVGAEVPEALKNWQEAFECLIAYLSRLRQRRKVVFLDELPWLDTPKSYFVQALEGFWNGWASGRHDIMLVVCGSATSWMMNKLIMNHGGLHNRLTRQIMLKPFTLKEIEMFLKSRAFQFSTYELALCY